MVDVSKNGLFLKWSFVISLIMMVLLPFGGTFLYVKEAVSILKIQVDYQNNQLVEMKGLVQELTISLKQSYAQHETTLHTNRVDITRLQETDRLFFEQNRALCQRIERIENKISQ